MNVWETFHFNVTWERFLWFGGNVLGTFWERKIVGWDAISTTVYATTNSISSISYHSHIHVSINSSPLDKMAAISQTIFSNAFS